MMTMENLNTSSDHDLAPKQDDQSTVKELKILRDKVLAARSAEMLFGELEGANAEKLAALNLKYFGLAKRCRSTSQNPDRTANELAEEVSNCLAELYRSAREKIQQGTYGEQFLESELLAHEEVLAIVESEQNQYALHELIAEGDVALIYRASCSNDSATSNPVCVKIARSAGENSLLENEQAILSGLDHVSLPKPLESFELPDGRAVNVLEYVEGLNFHQLRETIIHQNGVVDPNYHLGWILERQLSALGYLHSQGVVHGSIEPAHLIVQPKTHNVVLIDFCWASAKSKKRSHIKIAQEYYSPPEVYSKKTPHPCMDIYGLGKSIIYLLGGDPHEGTIPDSVDTMYRKMIERMVEEQPKDRAQDAYQLASHLVVIRDEISGKQRGFIPLPIEREAGQKDQPNS